MEVTEVHSDETAALAPLNPDIFHFALEACSDAVLITDRRARILYVNSAFERLTGYSKTEALGKNPRFLRGGGQSRAHFTQLWSRLSQGKTWRGSFINQKRDGTLYEEQALIAPLRDAGGEITHYIGVKRDAAEARNLETLLRQTEKMTVAGQLLAGVSDELHGPLAGIVDFTYLLLRGQNLAEAERRELQSIQTQAQRCRHIVQNLLLFSRARPLRLKSLELSQLLSMTLRLMRQGLAKADITLREDCSSEPLWVKGDAGELQQVLLNLLSNARHAVRGRKIRHIGVRAWREDPRVFIAVEDNGSGIPATLIDRIFDRFVTTKPPGAATGLGLTICREIIQRHGGKIEAKRNVIGGAVLTVELPIDKYAVRRAARRRL